MRTCPRCHAITNDTDNVCPQCGYIYNQEMALEKDMDQEYRKAVKKSKFYYTLMKFLLILFLLLLLILFVGMSFEPWFDVPIGLLLICGIYEFCFYIKNSSFLHEKIKSYTPEKHFKYYRRTTEQRKQPYKGKRNFFWILTACTAIYCILSLILRPNPSELWMEVMFSILLFIILFYFATINQGKYLGIKYHQTIDDASYFELEELQLIKETDVIIALYKDFQSWKDVKAGSKILILTQDSLVCLVFNDRTHAQKMAVALSKIDELGIYKAFIASSFTKGTANGMIITIGWQKKLLRILLKGLTIQDSAEEFVSRFLKQLDNAILNRPHDEVKTYQHTETSTSENMEQIRQIEIANIPETPSPNEAVASGTSSQPSRTIDL